MALPVLGQALAEGQVSGQAVSFIVGSVARVRAVAGVGAAGPMEHALVAQAIEGNQDVLAEVAAMWEAAADQDGTAPCEAALRAKQGMFYRGRRGGLHHFSLVTDDAQFQTLQTWWQGGTTRSSNGCLLCIFHHDLIDEGGWEIVVDGGVPWFIPPAYIDPQRRRRRNRYWHTAASAAAIGAGSMAAGGTGITARPRDEAPAVSTPQALWS